MKIYVGKFTLESKSIYVFLCFIIFTGFLN